MGLSINVYNNIKLVKSKDNWDFKAYVIDPEWLYKIKNLKKNKYYIGDRIFKGMSYSYSSHNRFREELIKLIDRTDLLNDDGKINWDDLSNDIPFIDFINFADNEGCLDWDVSKIIYLDFVAFNEKAKIEMNQYYYPTYETWLKTFEIAQNKYDRCRN